jgi:fido (protein-threonine AMPylation protein)
MEKQDNNYKSINSLESYIRHQEPETREKAAAWQTAIGLQAVDGLTTSQYLQQTAVRNIEGDITFDEARQLIDSYYQSADARKDANDNQQEADKASANIAKLLSEPTFTFSTQGLCEVHRRIFEGVFKHAGTMRDYNITKQEWVLDGDTVLYGSASELGRTIQYDLEQERSFSYRGLTSEQIISHLTRFVSNLWQIHPFCEGNTRTTAIFTIKYLRSIGFNVDNSLFAYYSWYFRNALVRSNYRNVPKGIEPDDTFLNRFFENLLLGKKNELKNRWMHVRAKEVLATGHVSPETGQAAIKTGQVNAETGQVKSKTGQVDMMPTNKKVIELINALAEDTLSVKELMERLELKGRDNFLSNYLNPAISEGCVEPLYPNSPRHPRQKYKLTVKGLIYLN